MKISRKKNNLLAFSAAVLLMASAFHIFMAPAAAGSKDKKVAGDLCVSSRECKMLLLAGKFSDQKAAMDNFWHIVEGAGSELGVKVKKSDTAGGENTLREVSFIDTKDFDLYKKGYMLRRRVENGETGLTLKFRNPDPAVSSNAAVEPGAGYDGKTSFEEDVVVKENALERVFSKSGKTSVGQDPAPSIGAWAAVYPGLAKLGLSEKTQLCAVNGVSIEESNFDYGTIYLTKNIKADASFAVWRLKGASDVFIAEFSYKYKFKNSPSEEELLLAHHASDKLLVAIRNGAKSWFAAGMTKTGLVYKFNANNAD